MSADTGREWGATVIEKGRCGGETSSMGGGVVRVHTALLGDEDWEMRKWCSW